MLAIVIFGITGELSRTKLIFSLHQLFEGNKLDDAHFFGFGRRPLSRTDFERLITLAVPRATADFLNRWSYVEGLIDEDSGYKTLATVLKKFTTRIVYLAVGPHLFEPIVSGVTANRVLQHHPNHKIVVEKPFGTDAISAQRLNSLLLRKLGENQIYRIDHYLGKAGLRSFLKYKPQRITSLNVTMTTREGVGARGHFFDSVGIVRDVVQNHGLQVISILLAWSLGLPRSKILRDIKLKNFALAQYVDYRSEANVAKNSTTPTRANLNLMYFNVPISVDVGIKRPKKRSELVLNGQIVVSLSDPKNTLLPHARLMLECINNQTEWFVTHKEIQAAWRLVAPTLDSTACKISY